MENCELCGEPMPAGEEMFKYHGYSGPCPAPPKMAHAASVSQWQPIKTAPKDGTPILAFRPDSLNHGFSPQSGIDLVWFEDGNWQNAGAPIAIDLPTHWMSLPAPPQHASHIKSP